MSFVIMPIFFLSGAIFPLHDLPKFLEVITRIDPMTYGVDALRGVLSGQNFFSLGTDVGILIGLCVVVLLIGSYLFSTIEL
jgi:ABC-2 type transport system permease protein